MKNKFIQSAKNLDQSKKELVARFLKGEEPLFLEKHSLLLDNYFRECFEESLVGPSIGISKNPYAIIALGGYGREEQCICSDVDILFLFKKNISVKAEELIREFLYPLWDIGLDIGHATRTIKDCTGLAVKDFTVLTSLMDARFICGMSILFTDLMEQLRKNIVRKRQKKIISWFIATNQERHNRFGDSSYLLEPNLKDGQGGLRDYHTMLWIVRTISTLSRRRDLEHNGYLSYNEFKAQTEALSFIWNVRNRLHHLAGRKCDRLHFEYQARLAKEMNFIAEHGQRPVERFLGSLHSRMEFIKEQHLMFLYEHGYANTLKRRKVADKHTDVDGLHVERDRLNFKSPEKLVAHPILLLNIFKESLSLKIPLSTEAKRLVKEFGYLVDDTFRVSYPVVKSFEHILITPALTFNVIEEMLSTGFLVNLIPEIAKIINRIQYDEYHLYPVDKHSLRVVQTIKQFGTKDDVTESSLCGDLYQEIKNRKIFLWAAFLHDIGKGEESGRHSETGALIAAKILHKRGYQQDDIETVSFLIKEHLFLIKTATRRDIYEEETAIFCARKIKDIDRLKMLYLLTVADSISTGPKAWNSWSLTLLRNLFFKILNILENGELATCEAVETIERKKKKVVSFAETMESKKELAALLSIMSPRYLLYMAEQDILNHISLFKSMGNLNFAWKIPDNLNSNTRTVTICAKDTPGLFSRIAGVFTLNGFDIIEAQVYTWRNNTAVDIFKLKAPLDKIFESEKWAKVKLNIENTLAGELDIASAIEEKMPACRFLHQRSSANMLYRPNRVVVDNDSSSFFTIIEVFSYDFPGLLFCITDALFRCGLDIWISKIATKVDQVVDVFYVRDFDGQKVDSPNKMEAVKHTVEQVLPQNSQENDLKEYAENN